MIKSSFLIAGKHAVTEALKNPNRKVLRIFLTEESKKKLNSENQNKHLLKNVKILYKTNKELDRLCLKDQISHQGLIAEIIPLEEANIKEYLKQNLEKKCITFAAIEGVTDPRNIGSIIRSASSFDIDGIIVVKRSYPGQSKLLYKSASGCIELLNIFEVSNISTTLKYLKSRNFWISGFDSQSKNDFLKHNWDGNNVLLFGSEGYGLKYQTKKNSDFLLRINMNKNVGSLNISNSASIIFHHLHQIKKIEEYENQYGEGLITRGEKYNKVVDAWSKCTDLVAAEMMKKISSTTKNDSDNKTTNLNSVFMMADSGARGSAAQMKQLAGMRGLIAKPSGEIIETPIVSNFKEGLTALEYFNSTHGARKGLADTALKTANSGYLTRRLCDVAQDLSVTIHYCGTNKNIVLSEIIEGGNILVSLSDRALGRTSAEDIKNPLNGEILIKKKEMIDEEACEKIDSAGVKSIKVFSVVTCESKEGICAICYGRDLSRGKLVTLGEAIGMIAAQSIGEPGTQLTMRTFHVGGTAQIKQESQVVAKTDGILKIINKNLLEDSKKNQVVMGRNTQLAIEDDNGQQIALYKIPYGAKLFYQNDEIIKKGIKICEWDPYTMPVIAEKSGIANYVDLIDGVSLAETVDDATGISSKSVVDWRSQSKNTDLKPRITLRDEKGNVIKKADDNEARYYLVPDSILSVKDGQHILAGDVIARLPKETSKTKDITGGLPRVAELFEARKPKESAIIAENDGSVIFGKEVRGKLKISIQSKDGEVSNYLIPKGKHINFNEGENIKKGEYLLDGSPAPHDILKILGVEQLTDYFVNEVQEVYRLQGVVINDKHIETIVRQMLKKVEIKDPGDSKYLKQEIIDKNELEEENNNLIKNKKKPAIVERVLLGITKASLQTNSFISAASFQETTRVLTDAAIKGKIDKLKGLKENVIVGRLVPAGTGTIKNKWSYLAKEKDKKYLSEKALEKVAEQSITAE